MKTVRFSQVVTRAGQPSVHVSWLPAAKDPILQRALSEHRVMTVHQELRGTRKDFGTVGLIRKGPGQILVFPKSLRRFAERKVVGIDYALLPAPSDQPELSSAAHLEPQTPAKARRGSGQRAPSKTGPNLPASNGKRTRRPNPQSDLRGPTHAATSTSHRAAEAPHNSPARPGKNPPSREELLAFIRRAAQDLKAGRAVPAYERLQAALGHARR